MSARSPLMYEENLLDFGGKSFSRGVFTEADIKHNPLDLDSQEVSLDLHLLLNSFEGLPCPPTSTPVSLSVITPSLIAQQTAGESVLTDTRNQESNPSQHSITQMPSVEGFIQPAEPSIARQFDLTNESSVDIQALLAYTGAEGLKTEDPTELPTCILQSFQAELEPSSDNFSAGEGTSTSHNSPGPQRTKKGKSKKRFPEKGSEEYVEKRSRNNIAVRKSRTKAKIRQAETEGRVKILTDENDRLQKKVDLLSKELNVLKGLFLNVGAALPSDFESVLQK